MPLKLSFLKTLGQKSGTIAAFITSNLTLDADIKKIDKASGGYITHALKNDAEFKGKLGQAIALTLPKSAGYHKLILIGLGDIKELTSLKMEETGGKLLPRLQALKASEISIFANQKLLDGPLIAGFSSGLHLRSYQFHRYKSKSDDKDEAPKVELKKIDMISNHHKAASDLYKIQKAEVEGVFLARDFVNEPPNHLHPESYAVQIRDELKPLGVEVEILDEKKMQKLGMGAILAVGMGSLQKPRIVIMRWNGSRKKTNKPVALVGKGVTFDTGGISIKPAAGMDEMKMDMGGSAAVVGAIKALALRKAKSNVVGIVGLAENMPSNQSYRPGDIIKSYSGKTIEVLNTDAEGRLVLADILTYVQQKYKPKMIIDLATLTGAMMVALGHEYCGTFVNDNELWERMEKASETTGEKLWRMPLDKVWKDDMVSDVADLQNLGKSGRFGGACTAAGFLEHFIDEGTPWAHMDIAGTAWRKKDLPTVPKYGSGFGVRILNQLIRNYYED